MGTGAAVADLTPERLAEILWTARSRARGVLDPAPLTSTPAYTRERYRRFAVEVRRLLDRDEVQRRRRRLTL